MPCNAVSGVAGAGFREIKLAQLPLAFSLAMTSAVMSSEPSV